MEKLKQLSNSQLLLKEIIKQEYQEDTCFDSKSTFFEFYTASQMLKDYDLSYEEIEHGIKGAGNDGGCDAIYLFLNGNLIDEEKLETLEIPKDANLTLMILQSKDVLSFKEDTLMKWKTTCSNLFQFSNDFEEFKSRYNEDILKSFDMFKTIYIKLIRSKLKLTVIFDYITLADQLHPNVVAQGKELIDLITSIFPNPNTKVLINYIGANILMEKVSTIGERKLNLPLVEAPIAIGRKKDYIALVKISDYYKFITDGKDELQKYMFESNVRDYQGKNGVNTEISKTLESNSGEDFWWLNNGVTLLASDANLATGKEIVISEPEIVNGLQTSNEIYNYFNSHKHALDADYRTLLLRIIVPEDDATRDRIILATNSQTSIPKSSLRVTDPIHWQIEMYFKNRGLFYDRRKNYYKNQGKKSKEIISVSFLAQCLITLILWQPDQARARPSTLLTNERSYSILYEENQNLDVFYNCARIGRNVENRIKQKTEYSASEKSDILFYVLYATVAKFINTFEITVDNLKSIDISKVTDEDIDNMITDIYRIYKELGGNSQVAKGKGFLAEVNKNLEYIIALQEMVASEG